jgi:hypothetical protein
MVVVMSDQSQVKTPGKHVCRCSADLQGEISADSQGRTKEIGGDDALTQSDELQLKCRFNVTATFRSGRNEEKSHGLRRRTNVIGQNV